MISISLLEVCVSRVERCMKGSFSFLVALYSSPQCMSKTDLYQRKWNWLHRMILLVHCAEKHKGDFFPFIIFFQLESSWVKLCPQWMQHLQLGGSPSKHVVSPHQRPAPVLAAELLWEKRAPSDSQRNCADGFPDWALHGLLPSDHWEQLLEAEWVQNTLSNRNPPHFLPIIMSATYTSSLSAWLQGPLLHNRGISLSSGLQAADHSTSTRATVP